MTKYVYLVVILFFFSFTKICALESIKIDNNDLNPLFDSNTHEYNYYTSNDSIVISVIKSNDEQVSGYGIFELVSDDNVFYITSSINEIETKYKINVYKNYVKEDEEVITFKELNVKNYDINFKNDVHEYNINLLNDSYLDINYILDNPSSIVEITNNGNFKSGNNKVTIVIKSESGNNFSKYIINVNKAVEVFKDIKEEKSLTYIQKEIIILIIIAISCSLIVYVFYLIFVKKLFI